LLLQIYITIHKSKPKNIKNTKSRLHR